MVANLTVGKEKFLSVEGEMIRLAAIEVNAAPMAPPNAAAPPPPGTGSLDEVFLKIHHS